MLRVDNCRDMDELIKVGWLVFNGTFSTKRLYRAKSKSLLKILISDNK